MTKAEINHLLNTNDRALCRALVLLAARQTQDERSTEATRHQNGRGFKPCHARMGTSMAKWYERKGYLSPKQIGYWRRPDATGFGRLACYWGQLNEEIEAKQAQKRLAA